MPSHASQLYARNVAALLAAPRAGGRARARLRRRDHRRRLRDARAAQVRRVKTVRGIGESARLGDTARASAPRGRRPRHPGWGVAGRSPVVRDARGQVDGAMTLQLVFELTILVLAIFLGFEVISKVPTLLHTPLMSGTNAIHGIVIVGAMLVAGLARQGHADVRHRLRRRRARVGERRRRLRRHRPHARDVQEARAAATSRRGRR